MMTCHICLSWQLKLVEKARWLASITYESHMKTNLHIAIVRINILLRLLFVFASHYVFYRQTMIISVKSHKIMEKIQNVMEMTVLNQNFLKPWANPGATLQNRHNNNKNNNPFL